MKQFISFLLSVVLAAAMFGCAGGKTYTNRNLNGGTVAYTIMVYIDGANLESDYGLASEDLREMMAAAYPRDNVNVIVQTGGTKKWETEGISSDEIGRYRISEGNLELLETLPQQNMVKKETLTDFINYCYGSFPAERYGLILWDHGAGPVIGYGVDQNYEENESMSLTSLKEAFQASAMAKQPLEFLGFDSCLMASVEIAQLLSPFANYLVASQETEPGQGWDYTKWLTALGTDPQMTGATLGTAIAQSFIEYYKINGLDMANLTLSVIDMTKIADLVSSFEAFIGTVDLSKVSFQEVAKDRSNTKEFGFSSAYEHHFDVVDIGDLAAQFSEKSAQESANLTAALSAAVVYSEKGQHDDIASGLSVYFPYNGRQYLNANMAAYKTLGFSSTYVNYIDSFVSTLTSTPLAQLESISQTPTTDESASAGRGLYRTAIAPEQTANIESVYATVWQEMPNGTYRQVYRDDTVQLDATTGEMLAEFDGRVTTVDGHIACMYELVRGDGFVRYNVPGFINREFVNLQIVFDETSPGGRVLGATPVINASQVAARQMLPIEEGSDLAMCYDALTPENYAEFETATIEDVGDYSSSGTSWTVGEYSTTGKTVTMATTDLPKGNYLFGFMVKDLQGNTYATKPIPFSRS